MNQKLRSFLCAVPALAGFADAQIVSPACQLGVLNLAANGGINPNTGVAWKVGDKYRLAFHTNGYTVTTSNNPDFYNDFSTTEAWTGGFSFPLEC